MTLYEVIKGVCNSPRAITAIAIALDVVFSYINYIMYRLSEFVS